MPGPEGLGVPQPETPPKAESKKPQSELIDNVLAGVREDVEGRLTKRHTDRRVIVSTAQVAYLLEMENPGTELPNTDWLERYMNLKFQRTVPRGSAWERWVANSRSYEDPDTVGYTPVWDITKPVQSPNSEPEPYIPLKSRSTYVKNPSLSPVFREDGTVGQRPDADDSEYHGIKWEDIFDPDK